MRQMHQFVFLTGGVVFLTLIINGSTTQFLLHHLNMNTITETKVQAFLAMNFLPFLTCWVHINSKQISLRIVVDMRWTITIFLHLDGEFQ